MPDVTIRDYKDARLAGGTLIVGVPQLGIAGVLLTDHILDTHKMDQIAAVDSDATLPIAMVRNGKPRYPARIHADPAARLAVLRAEVPPPTYLARGLAHAVLSWAARHGILLIVVLDNLAVRGPDGDSLSVETIASDEPARKRVRDASLPELEDGVLGGLMASILLEARFVGIDAIGLVAEVRSPLDEARSLLSFADALPRLVPQVKLDTKRLESESREVAETIRGLQAEIDRTMREMHARAKEDPAPIYG